MPEHSDTTAATNEKVAAADEYAGMMRDAIEDIQLELDNPSLRMIAAELNHREFTTQRGSVPVCIV